MVETQLPGYVRAYTGPTQITNEWPDIGLERRVVIHRKTGESLEPGVPPYAVHEERRGKGQAWTLPKGTFGLWWKDAIDIAKEREDTLLCTLNRVLPASDPPAPVPGRPPVANESYRMADQPTAERYIELSIVVGGVSFSGRLYRD
jgi:hypothetical protein